MPHVVLLGDSIFDNARYVPDGPPVVKQVREALPRGWATTLLAVDGNIVEDIGRQLTKVSDDATHLIVSVGGNDALGASGMLREPAVTVGDALHVLDESIAEFAEEYGEMLKAVVASGRSAAVCTVYDSIPGLGPAEKIGLGLFNEVILRTAFAAGVPVLDLRLICRQNEDYSSVSSIEPSRQGGAKIAAAIARLATEHNFAVPRSSIYF